MKIYLHIIDVLRINLLMVLLKVVTQNWFIRFLSLHQIKALSISIMLNQEIIMSLKCFLSFLCWMCYLCTCPNTILLPKNWNWSPNQDVRISVLSMRYNLFLLYKIRYRPSSINTSMVISSSTSNPFSSRY